MRNLYNDCCNKQNGVKLAYDKKNYSNAVLALSRERELENENE